MKIISKYYFFVTCYLLLTACCLHAQLNISPTIANATCPDTSDGSISVSVSGGTLPYTYQWLPGGQTTSAITGLSPGTYSISATDNDGINSTASYVVGPVPISDNSQIQSPFCTSNGSIIDIPSGGNGSPYQFLWNTGQTIAGILSIGAGNYSVIITDVNNCTANFSYSLTEIECFISPEQYFTPNGDGINDTWLIANAQYFDNIHLIVFDRWGTRVHEQRGTYQPWDGKSYFGIPVPDAVYYYFFYQDKDDKQKNAKNGSVTIIR